jgi:hypothetical protein
MSSNQVQLKKISIFENAISTKSKEISLNDYFNGIINGKWQDEVIEYRSGKREKTKITAITASGFFTGRKDADLAEHSGLLVIDIDEKDQSLQVKNIREQLKEIPEIFAIHYSLGGKGLAVYFKIKSSKHFESFDAISKMLANDYDIISDLHCSNIGRLRFVSYDPECHLNFGATNWNYFEKKEQRVNEHVYDNHIFSENDIDYILSQIRERQINIAPDYYSWVRIGFAIASKLGESGRSSFSIISNYYGGKQKINIDKQYDNCLRADQGRGGGISIKSFFYYAKNAGCNIVSERTQKIKTVAKIRRKQEQSSGSGAMVNGRQDARQYLEEYEGITGKDVDDILDQVWKVPVKDLVNEEGLLYDIEIFLKSNYKFRYNEITNIVEVDGAPVSDYIFNSIYLRAIRIVSDKITKDKCFDLIHSEFTPRYNPILEWFEKNKHIRTTGNIEKLAACISSDIDKQDKDFTKDFLEKWLISIIASAHGIYSILCMVLTGQTQGTGKTTFFRELLPDELRWLFSINKLDGQEADIGQLMCSKLLILDDEFGGKSKQDEKRFKELISKDIFSIRKPYGRYFEDMQRLAVLCGTTNDEKVINDLTGNRRIIPIQVNQIDEAKFREINKTELFIELYHKFRKNNTSWFLDKYDIERLGLICYDAVQVAPEMELPLKYFGKAESDDPRITFLSSSEIRSWIEKLSGIRLSQQKLSIALKNIGYEKTSKRINGVQIRGFNVIDYTHSFEQNTMDNEKEDELPF